MNAMARRARGVSLALCMGALVSCAPSRAVVWEGRTPDHRVSVAVHASREAQWVTIGDVEQSPFQGVSSGGVVFSPDSRELAYPARTDSGWVVVRAELAAPGVARISKAWDGIGALLFAPRGERLAWVAERDARWFVVEEGAVGPPFAEVLAYSLVYSADGGRLAYAARSVGGTHAVVGESVGPGFDAVGRIALSADGSRVAYAAREGERARVIVDGEAGPDWDAVGTVALSGDGGHCSYAAREEDRWRVVLDGVEGDPFVKVRGLEFDPAGRCVFVAADTVGEFVVRDGARGPRFDAIGRVAHGPDGVHWAYVGRSDGDRLFVDGQVVDERPAIGELAFSSDGSVLGYVVDGDAGSLVVIGGEEHPLDLVVGGSLVLNEDGTRWACLGGAAADERIRLVVDGEFTDRELDWGEYMDSLMSGSLRVLEDAKREEYFRAWVRAELGSLGQW